MTSKKAELVDDPALDESDRLVIDDGPDLGYAKGEFVLFGCIRNAGRHGFAIEMPLKGDDVWHNGHRFRVIGRNYGEAVLRSVETLPAAEQDCTGRTFLEATA